MFIILVVESVLDYIIVSVLYYMYKHLQRPPPRYCKRNTIKWINAVLKALGAENLQSEKPH